jgi:hypothetical protein
MKVQLKPEFHIVAESSGLFAVFPVDHPGNTISGWLALYGPALGEGSWRPIASVCVSHPTNIGTTQGKACTSDNWQVVAHKQFTARGWPSPWQVVR